MALLARRAANKALGGSAKVDDAVNARIVRPKDFIRTSVDGTLDLPGSKATLLSVASTIESAGTEHILIDTRQAQVHLSVFDAYHLGVAVALQPAVARAKTAILAPMRDEERAQFFALVAQNRGARLRAFTSFEEAITWLVMDE
jgi:hypothetical protein